MRPVLPVLSTLALLAACSASDAPAPALRADAAATSGGTVCPEEFRLELADYAETGVPAMDDDFLTLNAARDGVVSTDTGLQYKVVQQGLADGVVPELSQPVEVLYHGYYPDGEVFDSAYERNAPISFAPNQVIPGWTEALSTMKVCEARTLYVPGELAYGTGTPKTGARPQGTLVFNVQVLAVQ